MGVCGGKPNKNAQKGAKNFAQNKQKAENYKMKAGGQLNNKRQEMASDKSMAKMTDMRSSHQAPQMNPKSIQQKQVKAPPMMMKQAQPVVDDKEKRLKDIMAGIEDPGDQGTPMNPGSNDIKGTQNATNELIALR